MKMNILALIAGLIFGVGLCHSEMVDPAVVLGFLDVTGDWNPALAGVMGGALLVTGVTFRFIRPETRSMCNTDIHLPTKSEIDRPLVIGAVLFGVGWGLVGICPGPAVTVLSFFRPEGAIFFAAMMSGMAARRFKFSKTK